MMQSTLSHVLTLNKPYFLSEFLDVEILGGSKLKVRLGKRKKTAAEKVILADDEKVSTLFF